MIGRAMPDAFRADNEKLENVLGSAKLIEIQVKKFIEGRLVDNERREKTKVRLQQRAKNN
jgi:hypothetical protein